MKTLTYPIGLTTTLLLSGFFALTASADGRDGAQRGERRGPPPQAIEACVNLAAEAACEIETRRGDLVTGQCSVPRRQLHNAEGETVELVCVPERRARRRAQNELI